MVNQKSKDVNAKPAIKHINSLKTIKEVDNYLSKDEDRVTVIEAATEQKKQIKENTSEPKKEAKKTEPKSEPKSSDSKKDKPKKESKPAPKKENPNLNGIVSMALRGKWTRDTLHNSIKAQFPNSKVEVEEMNKKQVAFIIDGERVPEEGHFSVD